MRAYAFRRLSGMWWVWTIGDEKRLDVVRRGLVGMAEFLGFVWMVVTCIHVDGGH